MNTTTFWITLAVGALVALVASWRFSRSGSHPRFRPAMGVVLMVFMAIMGVVGFLAVVFGNMVGNKLPPVMNAEERKVWEAQQKSLVPSVPVEPVLPASVPENAVKPEKIVAPDPSGLPVPAPADLPEPADELPEPAPPTPEDVPPP